MIHILICEDNIEDLKHLSHLIQHTFSMYHIPHLIEIFDENVLLDFSKYNLIFLDMHLNLHNGIQLGSLIRLQCPNVPIIITSLYTEYLAYGYNIEAKRYLLKPLSKDEFQHVVKDVLLSYFKEHLALIDLKISPYKMYYKDLLYIEFMDRHTYLYLKNRKYRTTYSLSYWRDHLTLHDFGQPYKSFLVNYRHISDFSIDKKDIYLTNGICIPMSKRYKTSFLKGYVRYLQCSF